MNDVDDGLESDDVHKNGGGEDSEDPELSPILLPNGLRHRPEPCSPRLKTVGLCPGKQREWLFYRVESLFLYIE